VRSSSGPGALGYEVGTELVAANYRDTAVLNRTLLLLGTDFLAEFDGPLGEADGPELPDRVAALKGAVAEGFATAMRRQILDEQEEIQRAAIAAAQSAEERRRASEARFAAVFTEASVGIGMVGLDGVVMDLNGALADMLGIPAEDIRGRTIADVIGPTNVGEAYGRFLDLLNGTASRFRMETPHTRPDGRITFIDLSMCETTPVRPSS
jgi:PAS domain S-box-containing protein